MPPRVLLLQARDDTDPMRSQELACFARACGLAVEQFSCWNLLDGAPRVADLDGHDALMAGGSGDYFVSRGDLPEFERLGEFFAEAIDTRLPTFASCFGFQCLVAALGGEVVYDAERTEVGTYALELTAAGAGDEVLGLLPGRFRAQMGHKDRAERLPEGWLNLATSDLCSLQALRIPGRPVWATQFHPELRRVDNLERYESYLENYSTVLTAEERASALDRFLESPETAGLLPRFLAQTLGWREKGTGT